MTLNVITYANKSNLNPPTDVPKQATAEDFNEIKDVVNAMVAVMNGSSGSERYVYTIDLPSAASVAARIAAVTTLPAGWTLSVGASPLDLVITHSLSRRVGVVTVFATTSGTEQQQLKDTAAFSGIYTPDEDSCRIASLATISKPISIYLVLN